MVLEVWTEKYRPKCLDEVMNQKHVVERLKVWVRDGSIPNMMFAGRAGVGKTTLALALAREIFGEHWKENFLELNASDERGIDVVRGKVKNFARTVPIGASFKIIFLDESDALTPEAQQALRRTMEKYTGVCRFVLSCVTPETKILLPGEREISIGDFTRKFENRELSDVISLGCDKSGMGSEKVLCCVTVDPRITGKRLLEITTSSGRKLKVTEDHPLLTENGWKKVDKLVVGDRIVVYPHLEGTGYDDDDRAILDPDKFIKFLLKKERMAKHKSVYGTNKFVDVHSHGKRTILERVRELEEVVKSRTGLTTREYEIYRIIKRFRGSVERGEIQERIGLSRIRTAQLLKSIEKKGYIKRQTDGFNKRVHCFQTTGLRPVVLRNRMDIKRIIRKEFGIDVSYSKIKVFLENGNSKTSIDKIIEMLTSKGLASLSYDSEKIGAFTRIFAFIFGDGHITKNGKTIVFTGNSDALNEVKKDLKLLGFDGTGITKKVIENFHKGRHFVGTTTFFHLNSVAFVRMLEFLGAPVGDKITAPYKIPAWVMNGTKFVKREFVRSLYGCEGCSPKSERMNFFPLALRMHKSRKLENNMLHFLRQVSSILMDFDVESYMTIRNLDYRRTDGHITDSYELILHATNENMLRFFSRIGYAYEKGKDIKARLAAEYLRSKLFSIEHQKKKAECIKIELCGDSHLRSLAKKCECSLDFVINQKNGKDVHLPRSFPLFDEWAAMFANRSGFVLNEIVEMKEIESEDVMDIMCLKNHNFIANGIISHNCNYSSKIIEPIQSRCAVFRFKSLSEADVISYLESIVKSEKLKADGDALKAVYEISEGDMRRATNLLQSSAALGHITRENIYDAAARAKPGDVKRMMELAVAGRFGEARKKLYDMVISQGLSGTDIIKEMHSQLFEMDIPEVKKLVMVEKMGESEFRLNQGGTPEIQIGALLAQFAVLGK